MPNAAAPTPSPLHPPPAGALGAGVWRAALWGAAGLSAAASVLHGIGTGAGLPSHDVSVARVVDVLAATAQMLLAVVLAMVAPDDAEAAAPPGPRAVLLRGVAVSLAIGLWFAAPFVWPAADGVPHAGAHGTPASAAPAAIDLLAMAIETLLVATLAWLSTRAARSALVSSGAPRASAAARARDPDHHDPGGDDRREDDHRPGH